MTKKLVRIAEHSPPFTLDHNLPIVSNQRSVTIPLTCSRATLQPAPVINSIPTVTTTGPPAPPSAPPVNCPVSDTDSDVSISIMNNAPLSKFAEVEQRDQTKLPILTLGKMTPKALNNFSDGCDAYFFHKSIAADKQVQAVVLGIKDHRIRDWYRASKVTIITMTFADFMTTVQSKLLKDGWEYSLNVEILSSTQGIKPFGEWETELGASNSLLIGSTYHVSEATICSHLTANMNPNLTLDCDAAKTCDIIAYNKWLSDVTELDIKRNCESDKHKRLVEDALKAEHTKSRVLYGPSARGNKAVPTSVTASSSFSPLVASIPKLTPADRALLNEHEGCYKCRRFYDDHQGKDCPHGFPNPATYKPLTEAGTQAVKRKKDRLAAVAAVMQAEEEVVVAAVGMSSAVIGNGTNSDEYVDPMHCPHIYWDCLVDSPTSETPVPVHALIDIGCTTVLINPTIANSLRLTRIPLHKPMDVSLAISAGDVKKSFQLHEFVTVKLYSVDQTWVSKTVRAVVAPRLCTSIILGQSFLAAHSIVIDCRARMVIDKRCGRDILITPTIQKKRPTKLEARCNLPKCGTIHHQKIAAIKELKQVALPFLRKLTDRCGASKPAKPEQFLGLVRMRVEQLATAAVLNDLDTNFKDRFAD